MDDLSRQLMRMNARLRSRAEELEDKTVLLGEQLIALKNALFGKSSEKVAALESSTGEDLEPSWERAEKSPPRLRVRMPSERYSDAELIERHITFERPPACSCCGETLTDSGLTEDREVLTKIPEQFLVVRERRHQYGCKRCHGGLQTAQVLPVIKKGSAFSGEFIQDVAISKFCELIPIERQVKMAEREGFPGLPPQSLIETTHYLEEFLAPLYERLKTETLSSRVLHADETPHRILEGDKTPNWYFWFFFLHESRLLRGPRHALRRRSCESTQGLSLRGTAYPPSVLKILTSFD